MSKSKILHCPMCNGNYLFETTKKWPDKRPRLHCLSCKHEWSVTGKLEIAWHSGFDYDRPIPHD